MGQVLDLSTCVYLINCFTAYAFRLHPSYVTEHFTYLDTAEEQEWNNNRLTLSMFFLHHWWIYVPATYDGVEYLLDGFLLQCWLFHEGLMKPKPAESIWVRYMIH